MGRANRRDVVDRRHERTRGVRPHAKGRGSPRHDRITHRALRVAHNHRVPQRFQETRDPLALRARLEEDRRLGPTTENGRTALSAWRLPAVHTYAVVGFDRPRTLAFVQFHAYDVRGGWPPDEPRWSTAPHSSAVFAAGYDTYSRLFKYGVRYMDTMASPSLLEALNNSLLARVRTGRSVTAA